ncbi:hypothetical protein [Klebsiella pneumoniae]|uniref:hypothetical protein n=1 Tax=Klebsiella pneumoniae TaxID=573 RepID=UPI0013775B0C|nr:hypothetical protein [Klebsiella pneumoniae]
MRNEIPCVSPLEIRATPGTTRLLYHRKYLLSSLFVENLVVPAIEVLGEGNPQGTTPTAHEDEPSDIQMARPDCLDVGKLSEGDTPGDYKASFNFVIPEQLRVQPQEEDLKECTPEDDKDLEGY